MSGTLYESEDFEVFYLRYLELHADPQTRDAHAVGTLSAAALLLFGAATRRPSLVLLAPLVDYAIAQASHRVIEGNVTRPWHKPHWHARAELRMCAQTCRRWWRPDSRRPRRGLVRRT